jgi:Predicted membrane protein|tara:strand:+ start:148 stop:486 length:339 start_codon:yes stop_codon:yes gene_type:complete
VYEPLGQRSHDFVSVVDEAVPGAHGTHCKEFMPYAKVPGAQYAHIVPSFGSCGLGLGGRVSGIAGGGGEITKGGGGGGFVQGGGDGGGSGDGGGDGGGDGCCTNASRVMVNL